jgi:tRNA pseudouridine13 synthase
MAQPLSDADRARMLAPPPATAALPGIGGRLRATPEDFEVIEVPAYPADGGEGGHVLVWLHKRGMTTDAAVAELARHCGVPRGEIGVAGLKDQDAVTRQQVSLPAAATAALATFSHPSVHVENPRAHSHKLRRGHLRGNRFAIVVRDVAMAAPTAEARVRAKLAQLAARGGLDNAFGDQRFGAMGRNLAVGLKVLGKGRSRASDAFVTSAAQSGLFNLWLALRREDGLDDVLLPGDVVVKADTGGMFDVEDAEREAPRLRERAIVVTGPMFGAKMRAPRPDSPAGTREAEVLARAGITAASLRSHGKRLPGTRRRLRVPIEDPVVAATAAGDGSSCAVRLEFGLPAGSYATVLLRELMEP